MKRSLAAAGPCFIPWKGSFPQACVRRCLRSDGNISPKNSPLRQQQRCNRFLFSPRATDLQRFPRAGLCAVCDKMQEHKNRETNKTFFFLLLEPKMITSHSVQFTVRCRPAPPFPPPDPVRSPSPCACTGWTPGRAC